MRWNFRCRASASVRTSSVLPSPGTPSSSTWPPAIKAVSVSSTISREADDHLADLAAQRLEVRPEPVELLFHFVGRAGYHS